MGMVELWQLAWDQALSRAVWVSFAWRLAIAFYVLPALSLVDDGMGFRHCGSPVAPFVRTCLVGLACQRKTLEVQMFFDMVPTASSTSTQCYFCTRHGTWDAPS